MGWLGKFDRSGDGATRLSRRVRLALGGAAMAALVAGGAAGDAIFRASADSHAASALATAPSVGGAPISFADMAARVRPAVVSVQVRIINAQAEQAPQTIDPFGDFFHGFPFENMPQIPEPPREGQAQGSGFFISPDGYIVTNNHVVRDARSVTVTLDNGRTVNAHVVASDPRTDLAVLKTDSGAGYRFVRFASAAPRVGDWVIAVGNPFGLGGSVTAGIVSASGRDIGAGPYDNFLQIDAPVNQGNSGGPVFNMNGEVVGVSTAIASPSGGNVGIAFAIPAASAQPIVETLQHGGRVVRGFLGVSLQPLDDDIARSLGLRDHEGALVAEVNADGPAARAGLHPGDVILRADGQQIADSRDLARVVAAHRPGTRLALELLRGGRRMQATPTLAAMPAEGAAAQEVSPGAFQGSAGAALGLQLAPVESGGVQVLSVDPDSPAASHGLQPGDVILDAGGRPCASAADLQRAADAAQRDGRGAVLLRVQSGNQTRFVGLPLSDRG